MTRPVQYFSKEYLEQCRKMTPFQVAVFLDEFRRLHAAPGKAKTRLISLKVEEDLLRTFRERCRLRDTPYQTQIKRLMREWLSSTK